MTDGQRDDGGAFAEERHAAILKILGQRGRIRNTELAALLGVTEPTVRKDVADLARQNLLHRTHGGVIAQRPSREPDLPTRVVRNVEAKTRIARRCLAMIADGDAVFLDGGSTVLRIAELLAEGRRAGSGPHNANVLTDALPVAQVLAEQPGVRSTLLGGSFRPSSGVFVGPLAVAAIKQFTVNLAFLGVTGVSEDGFTVADLAEAQLKQAVMDRARRVVVVMDRSKVGAADFAKVCEVDAVGTIVTDEADDFLADLCATAGVELLVAG